MQHWLPIAGSGLGIVGTAALSFELLKSRTEADSLSEFRRDQDQADSTSQELIVTLNKGLMSLGQFVASYLSLQVLEEQQKETGTADTKTGTADPGLDSASKAVRRYAVDEFKKAQAKLANTADLERALALIAEVRKRIERRFTEEVAKSKRLRRVAIGGICLVGAGAVAQLMDLLL